MQPSSRVEGLWVGLRQTTLKRGQLRIGMPWQTSKAACRPFKVRIRSKEQTVGYLGLSLGYLTGVRVGVWGLGPLNPAP